jgi:hypothetical protein
VSRLEVPEETANHPYFEFHELADPREQKVAKRSAFGTHWALPISSVTIRTTCGTF